MTDAKALFAQLDSKFSKIHGKTSTDFDVAGDVKAAFDKKTFDDYTKFLEDEAQNIRDLVETMSKEEAKNKAGAVTPAHIRLPGARPGPNVAQAAIAAPPAGVSTEAYWWGFHIVIPEQSLKYIMASSDVSAVLAGAFAAAPPVAACPPAAFLVVAAAAAIALEGVAMTTVDQGNGVYLSWCWIQVPMVVGCPALALPVPTAIQ
jgi:hypothetical protein